MLRVKMPSAGDELRGYKAGCVAVVVADHPRELDDVRLWGRATIVEWARLRREEAKLGAVIIANSTEPEAAQRELQDIGHLLGAQVTVTQDILAASSKFTIEVSDRADDHDSADRWRRIERIFWRVYLTPTDTRSYSVRKRAAKLRDEHTTPWHRPRMTRVVVRRKAKS